MSGWYSPKNRYAPHLARPMSTNGSGHDAFVQAHVVASLEKELLNVSFALREDIVPDMCSHKLKPLEIMLIMRKREPHYFDRLMWDPTPFRGLVVKDSQGGQDKQGHDSAMAGAHGEQHAELYEDEDEDKVLP